MNSWRWLCFAVLFSACSQGGYRLCGEDGDSCGTGQVCDKQSRQCVDVTPDLGKLGNPPDLAQPSGCRTAIDCPSGQICSSHVCAPCSEDGSCGAGKLCEKGACVPGNCRALADCPSGKICKDNSCAACTDKVDDPLCGMGNVCQGNTCVVGTCNLTYPNGVGCSKGTTSYCFPDKVKGGTINQFFSCRICDPARSATDWSVALDGTPCGTKGGTCQKGSCTTGQPNGQACYSADECLDGSCADPGPLYSKRCGYCMGPGESCYNPSSGCCSGMACVPTMGCDSRLGATCLNVSHSPCL